VPSRATFQLTALVPERQNYALQIGALPGAYRVWVNGVLVAESGVLSADPDRFRAEGTGSMVSLQPRDGRLDIVVQVATLDPLVIHSEMNRKWVLGLSAPLLGAYQVERNSRVVQVTFLSLGVLLFIALSFLRSDRRTIFLFVAFLVLCLLKLVWNVEEVYPLLSAVVPGISPSVYLFLNHGLNLLPFPLLVLFLVRQFPEDVSFLSFVCACVATLVFTLWELFPFVVLSLGMKQLYTLVMGLHWSLFLDLYVVVMVLFVFERFYFIYSKRRPLSGALFYGGLGIGLIILLPIPLSYFFSVKYTLFFGWGLFLFLLLLGSSIVRQQIHLIREETVTLTEALKRSRTLGRFLPSGWSSRLGRDSLEALSPGDRRSSDAVFVQVCSQDSADLWLPTIGLLAEARQALLVHWREGTGVWVIDSWPEHALAFALEVQRSLATLRGLRFRIVLTKASVEFRVLDAGPSWVPTIDGAPWNRLAELARDAGKYGACLVLDAGLKDGLVIGGWRHHRSFTLAGTEIELYDAEEEPVVQSKDRSLEGFETALAHARSGQFDLAVQAMAEVVLQNPLDFTARVLLNDWSRKTP